MNIETAKVIDRKPDALAGVSIYRRLWSKIARLPWLRVAVHVGALIPLALLIWDAAHDNLTANPIQAATFRTGKPALVLLVVSLACTPLHTVFGWHEPLKVRRALGLYSFMYVALHFLIFVYLDYGLDLELLIEAVFEKRYALVGFAAGIILLMLAATSFRFWQVRMKKNWKRLHRLVYLASLLAVTHYVWLVKSDIRQPLAFGAVVGLLLLLRVPAIKRRVINLRQRIQAQRAPASA